MRIFTPLSLNFILQYVSAKEQMVTTFVPPSRSSACFIQRATFAPAGEKPRHVPLSSTVERKQLDSSATQMFGSNDSTELPPHTALAQVLANQYNIDLSSVEPSSTKITAADVEFHAYKISQPPCTPQALELAYSHNLDLNDLYDEYADYQEEGEEQYFLRISDVELYLDNMRSFRASTQKIRGKRADKLPADIRRREKHLKELEKRIEKNAGQLSQKAMQAVDSVANIVQTAQAQVKLPVPGVLFGLDNSKVDSVQDFDQDLANEIQAALMSAGIDEDETESLLSMLDMPLNGNTDKAKADVINGSIQNGANGTVEDQGTNKAVSFFFADPK